MKKKVTFEVKAPAARQVFLVGDFTKWESNAKRMRRKRGSKVIFSTSVSLGPGSYEYKYIVDGEWREDPEAPRRSNEFGTENSVISVS